MNATQPQIHPKRAPHRHAPDLRVAANDGNVLTQADTASNVTNFTYDAADNLLAAGDTTNGQRTQLAYDNRDRLIRRTDAAGKTTTFSYGPQSDFKRGRNSTESVF